MVIHYVLNLILWLPLIAALILTAARFFSFDGISALAPRLCFWASFLAFVLLLFLVSSCLMDGDLRIHEEMTWISAFSVRYSVGLDGLNVLPAVLIAFIFPVLLFSENKGEKGLTGIHELMLVLQSSLFGVLFSQDLFLMFFFWVFSSLPFIFFVGIWGGEKKEEAVSVATVYSSLGNAFFLAALVLIYHYSFEVHSFSFKELSENELRTKTLEIFGRGFNVSNLSFLLLCLGLALRGPLWPTHRWFLKAAEQSPPSVLVALSSASFPVLIFIFVKVAYLVFPKTFYEFSSLIVLLGALNVFWGTVNCLLQKDMRHLFAYLCSMEVGFILMGSSSFNSMAVIGAFYQLVSIGVALAGLGLILGVFLKRDASFHELGGLMQRAPRLLFVFAVVLCSIVGFPGFGSFVGHGLVVVGSFSVYPWIVLLMCGALIFAMYFLFSLFKKIFLGNLSTAGSGFVDLSRSEGVYFFSIVATLLFLGVFPKPFLDLIKPAVYLFLPKVGP